MSRLDRAVSKSVWLFDAQPSPDAELRLFCLPYAGAGATVFRAWMGSVPAGLDVCSVQLPGRETRASESPCSRMPELVSQLAEGLRPHLDRPFALFGHSMGALVCFELSRHLRREGGPGPSILFASGCRAPQIPPDDSEHRQSDSELVDELRRLNGTPKELLQDAQFLSWYLPLFRADLALCESYEYVPEEPLGCPITVFHGEKDEEVSREASQAWAAQTSRAFSIVTLPGDHMFIQSDRDSVLVAVFEQLRGLRRLGAGFQGGASTRY